MSRMTDMARVKVATAYANGDLDDLRLWAMTALQDLDAVLDAYDGLVAEAAASRDCLMCDMGGAG